MKKLLTITAIAGLAVAAYSQGEVTFQNQGSGIQGSIDLNTAGTLSLATSFTVALYYGDVGGAAVTTPLANADQYGYLTYSAFQADQASAGLTLALTGTENVGPGTFNAGTATLGVPGSYSGGVNGTYAQDVMAIAAWTGGFSTLAQAVAGGAEVGIITFLNNVGPGGSSPALPTVSGWNNLTPTPAVVAFEGPGYPDLVMSPVPEPTTLALAALGGAAMLLIRRKK
jgi:hypothetical protein